MRVPVCTTVFHYVAREKKIYSSEPELFSGSMAQVVERQMSNPKVEGSRPGLGSYIFEAQNAPIVPCT